MDFQDLASRLGIDEEDFIELVELFIDTTKADIEKIRSGVADRDADQAAAASHSIKGAAGNLGLNELFELAKSMEMQAKAGSIEGFDGYIEEMESKLALLQSQP